MGIQGRGILPLEIGYAADVWAKWHVTTPCKGFAAVTVSRDSPPLGLCCSLWFCSRDCCFVFWGGKRVHDELRYEQCLRRWGTPNLLMDWQRR